MALAVFKGMTQHGQSDDIGLPSRLRQCASAVDRDLDWHVLLAGSQSSDLAVASVCGMLCQGAVDLTRAPVQPQDLELREAIAAVVGGPSDGSPVMPNPLRGPPDRLARPRTRLGDAGPGGELHGPAEAD